MEKIIKIAFEAKFPSVNLENIMEVLRATGNEVIAAEILLGIYEEPKIPKQAQLYRNLCTFESFDKFKEQVKYSTDSFNTKSLYFDSEEAANACVEYDTSIGRDYYNKKDGDFKKEFKIPSKSYSVTSLKEWMEGSQRI